MYKLVNGVRVELTPEEVAEIERMAAEYTAQETDEPVTWCVLAEAIKSGVNDV